MAKAWLNVSEVQILEALVSLAAYKSKEVVKPSSCAWNKLVFNEGVEE